MATIDLGKIKLVWRGTYAGGTAYAVDDVVGHTDGGLTSSFICTTASTGNAPSTGGTVHGSWAYLAKGGAAGTNGTDVGTVITTAGDLLYRDGSGLQRLAKGTASQVLTMNSGATAPEWATAAAGGLDYNSNNGGTQNVWYSLTSSTVTVSSSTWTAVVSLTLPTLSSAKRYWVTFTEDRREENWSACSGRYMQSSDNGSNWTRMGESGENYDPTGNVQGASGNNFYHSPCASYLLSYGNGDTPKFQIEGYKFGNSNPYRSGGQGGYNSIVAVEVGN